MQQKIVTKLAQLNFDFYQKVGPFFDTTRQHYWPGWWPVIDALKATLTPNQKRISVLDVGCGNGRFGMFLHSQLPNIEIEYTGIDADEFLLSKAATRTKSLAATKFIHRNLLEFCFQSDTALVPADKTFNLIVYFGVQHHIPGLKNRQKLVASMTPHLIQKGLLALTCWQFNNLPQFKNRLVKPEKVGINADLLEPNDYIIDWRKGKQAYRYCHLTQEEEIEDTLLSAGLEIESIYEADSKYNNGNLYVIASKAKESTTN